MADVSRVLADALKSLENAFDMSARDKMKALDRMWGVRESLSKPLKDYCDVSVFMKRLRVLLADPAQALRAATLRTIRHYLNEKESIVELTKLKMHVFIAKSLERDKKYEMERCQALKLVRRIVEIDADLIPRGLAAAVVSVASNIEDPYSRMCLQTLCDLMMKNVHIATVSGGLRVIVNYIISPPSPDVVELLSLTLVHAVDFERTRKCIEHDLDFAAILSPLTDTYVAHDPDIANKRSCSVTFMLTMLRCWPGLIFLSSVHGAVGLTSIVDALNNDDKDVRTVILSALFKVFGLQRADGDDFHAAMRRAPVMNSTLQSDELLAVRNPNHYDLYMCYMSSVLLAFVHCGLVPTLVSLGISDDRTTAIASTILLGEILHLANRLLPKSLCAQLHALPSLVNSAASFSNDGSHTAPEDAAMRSHANTLLSNLSEFGRVKKLESQLHDFRLELLISHTNEARRLKGTDTTTSSNLLDSMKMRMKKEMDEATFQALLAKSGVLGTKEYDAWNWDVIAELVEGPLTNVKRLNETILKTKFIKRLLSFYRPTRMQFADLDYRPENIMYVRTACNVLDLLVMSEEGEEYLKQNDLLQQIANFCTVEASPDKKGDRFLTKERIRNKMTREYFTMIGVLSRTKRGQAVLQHFQIFMCLYPLTETEGREDLSALIVTSLDYNIEGHTRILLAKTMTSKRSPAIRFQATAHMLALLRAGVVDFKNWGVDLLITQLSDEDAETSQKALSILNESCDDPEILQALISKQPKLEAIGALGKELLMRFLSTSDGFNFLANTTWLEAQMDVWLKEGNKQYVVTVETMLAKVVSPFLFRGTDRDTSQTSVSLPPHFFGELAKTPAGCQLLKDSKHVAKFVEAVCTTACTPEAVAAQKQALWAMGHIGASVHGYAFIEESKLLPYCVKLAETSPTLSIRGTAYYVIGLLSTTGKGKMHLQRLGWESQRKNGICVPKEPTALLSLPAYESHGLWPAHACIPKEMDVPPPFPKAAAEDAEKVQSRRAEVAKLAGNLGNHISADAAYRNLKGLKRSDAEVFTDVGMHCLMLQFLSMYKFRPEARRLIYDLFDSARFDNPSAMDYLDKCAGLDAVFASDAAS